MDLSTIETKLLERGYKMVSEFKTDISLMFSNCRLYNGPESGNFLKLHFGETFFILQQLEMVLKIEYIKKKLYKLCSIVHLLFKINNHPTEVWLKISLSMREMLSRFTGWSNRTLCCQLLSTAA